jgi:hypothetical protein
LVTARSILQASLHPVDIDVEDDHWQEVRSDRRTERLDLDREYLHHLLPEQSHLRMPSQACTLPLAKTTAAVVRWGRLHFPEEQRQFLADALSNTWLEEDLPDPVFTSPFQVTEDEDEQLLRDGIWEVIRVHDAKWTHQAFKRRKADGVSSRMIANCRPFDGYTRFCPPPTDLPSFAGIDEFVAAFSYAFTVDFRSWYNQIPVKGNLREHLCIRTSRGLRRLRRLPMGLRRACSVAQMITLRIIADAGLERCSKAIYDDIMVGSASLEEGTNNAVALMNTIDRIEAELASEKCSAPLTSVVFMGMRLDLEKKSRRLDESWVEKTATMQEILDSPLTYRSVLSLVGACLWIVRVLNLGMHRLIMSLRWVSAAGRRDIALAQRVRLQQTVRSELSNIISEARTNRPYNISIRPESPWIAYSDASTSYGVGICLVNGDKRVTFGCAVSGGDINELELTAAAWALYTLNDMVTGQRLRIFVDNTTCLSWLRSGFNHGRTGEAVGALMQALETRGNSVEAAWISTEEMQKYADPPSRGHADYVM